MLAQQYQDYQGLISMVWEEPCWFYPEIDRRQRSLHFGRISGINDSLCTCHGMLLICAVLCVMLRNANKQGEQRAQTQVPLMLRTRRRRPNFDVTNEGLDGVKLCTPRGLSIQ